MNQSAAWLVRENPDRINHWLLTQIRAAETTILKFFSHIWFLKCLFSKYYKIYPTEKYNIGENFKLKQKETNELSLVLFLFLKMHWFFIYLQDRVHFISKYTGKFYFQDRIFFLILFFDFKILLFGNKRKLSISWKKLIIVQSIQF